MTSNWVQPITGPWWSKWKPYLTVLHHHPRYPWKRRTLQREAVALMGPAISVLERDPFPVPVLVQWTQRRIQWCETSQGPYPTTNWGPYLGLGSWANAYTGYQLWRAVVDHPELPPKTLLEWETSEATLEDWFWDHEST